MHFVYVKFTEQHKTDPSVNALGRNEENVFK